MYKASNKQSSVAFQQDLSLTWVRDPTTRNSNKSPPPPLPPPVSPYKLDVILPEANLLLVSEPGGSGVLELVRRRQIHADCLKHSLQ